MQDIVSIKKILAFITVRISDAKILEVYLMSTNDFPLSMVFLRKGSFFHNTVLYSQNVSFLNCMKLCREVFFFYVPWEQVNFKQVKYGWKVKPQSMLLVTLQ